MEEKEEEIKVAIYKRVSTDEQVNRGHSLEEQEKLVRSHCEIYNYKVYKVYSDEGFSGSETTKRKAFNQMMKDMRLGKFKKIIALKLDRITINLSDFTKFTDETREYGCGFEFVLEKFDTTTPSGRMILNILGVFAQFEREVIHERTVIGVRGAIEKGHYGGPIPFGYKKEKESKLYIIDEETAPIVREIFDLCLKGRTYVQIANLMKEKYGNMTYNQRDKFTGEKTTRLKSWTDSTIGTILNNKIYYGVWEHNKKNKKVENEEKIGFVPQIITKDIFDECQQSIKKNIRNYYRNKMYLFMQKLVCPKCGRIMACNGTRKPNGKDYLYYKCKDCKTYFREDLIVEVVKKELTKLFKLYLVLEGDYIVIDNNIESKLKNGKTDNSIRYKLDSLLIETLKYDFDLVDYLWNNTSYETKCRFIMDYIDTIKLKQYKRKGETIVELIELNIKNYKFQEFLEMKEKNILDDVDLEVNSINYSTFNSRKKADDYIEVLKDKFNINVVDLINEKDFIIPENIFRIIKIDSKRAVEKDALLCLGLSL